MNRRVSIQRPCHMSWSSLDKVQNSKNRHCSECQIDIIDFTQMSNDEIFEYLSKRREEKVCAKIYSVNKNSRYSKSQEIILNWHEKIKTKVHNRHFKPVILGVLGLMLFTTGCIGEPALEVQQELVPDNSTVDPSDSTYVEVCN